MSTDYPAGLKGPDRASHTPKQRVFRSELPGPTSYKNRERDYSGTIDVEFFFSREQAATFFAWWRDTLVEGGLWFNCTWPSVRPGGMIAQFTSEPQFSHVLDGATRVSSTVQIRGVSEAVAYNPACTRDPYYSCAPPFVRRDILKLAYLDGSEDSVLPRAPATVSNPSLISYGSSGATFTATVPLGYGSISYVTGKVSAVNIPGTLFRFSFRAVINTAATAGTWDNGRILYAYGNTIAVGFYFRTVSGVRTLSSYVNNGAGEVLAGHGSPLTDSVYEFGWSEDNTLSWSVDGVTVRSEAFARLALTGIHVGTVGGVGADLPSVTVSNVSVTTSVVTVLSIHADTSPVSDSSCYRPKVVTEVSNIGSLAYLDTETKRFGKSSLRVDNAYSTGKTNKYTVADHSDFDFGTADFTIEMWAYARTQTGVQTLFRYPSGGIFGLTTNSAGIIESSYYDATGGSRVVSTGVVFPLMSWQHVAVQRRSGGLETYLNGALISTVSILHDSSLNSSGEFLIGGTPNASTQQWGGNIDEVRITRGIGRYGASTPTPAAALTDSSGVVLLLNMNGTSGSTTFTDSSTYHRVPTTVATGASVAVSPAKFSESGNFTGGYLQYADSEDWNFGSGDFTVECWVMFNSASVGARSIVFGQGGVSGSNDPAVLTKSTTGILKFEGTFAGGTTFLAASSNVVSVNTWYHIACVRSGRMFLLYVSGELWATATSALALINSTSSFGVGITGDYVSAGYGGVSGTRMMGWIDDFRVTKGVARYVPSFTPPSKMNCDHT